MEQTRRRFLVSLGVGSISALAASRSDAIPQFPSPRVRGNPPAFFEPISPSNEDALILPKGVRHRVLIRWGDPLGTKAPDGSDETFGFNCDFTALFPLPADLERRPGGGGKLLWVNHEYPSGLFIGGYTPAQAKAGEKKTREQIAKERRAVGGSIVHLRQDGPAGWSYVVGSKYNRRLTADYPMIDLSGPVKEIVPQGKGTLAGCSGGRTPWMTALSCEENYPDYNGTREFEHRWADVEGMGIDEKQYGWVVEVDPWGVLPPRKHSALGRFKHENCAIRVGPGRKLVIYMGDDEVDQHLYKYVSAGTLDPRPMAFREQQRKLLEEGTLYVADMAKGKWVPLVYNEANEKLIEKSEAFADAKKKDPKLSIKSQAELLMHTRIAAKALGATPLDRCEDCEVHPLDGSLYVALTNNSRHGNLFGHIVRLVEDRDDPEGDSFQYEIYLAGGPQSGMACPDNLAFDRNGNLWVACDISSDKVGRGAYRPFGNNGLFVVPTRGPSAGEAFQFASGPIQSELTGPWFTDNYSNLILSVQHPGEESRTLANPTSRWPDGGDSLPKPSVVMIDLPTI